MKKLLKILVWIAGIIVVLLIITMIGLKLLFPVEKVKQLAVERGSAQLGREIELEGLDISFWGGLGVKLENVTIGNPPGFEGAQFLVADYVDLKLQLLPLIFGDMRVDRLIIDAPRIHMYKTATGAVNYDFAVIDSGLPPEAVEDMAPEAKTAAAVVSFDELEINDGLLVFHDDSSGLELQAVGLDLTTSLENPNQGLYRSSGKLRIHGVKVSADDTYPTVSLGLHYKVEYDLTSQRMSIEKADIEVNELDFIITGEATDPFGTPAAQFHVKSDRVTVANLLTLLPESYKTELADFKVTGDFSLDVDLDYDADITPARFLYSGTAVLTDLAVSKNDIDGELRLRRCLADFKPDNLRLTIEEGSFDGSPLRGHLVVNDFKNPELKGELAGQFDLAYLVPFLPAEDGHRMSGRADFDVKLAGRSSQITEMTFSGNMAIEDARYVSSLLPEPVERLSAKVYFDNELIRVHNLACEFPSGNISFAGRFEDLLPYLLADSVVAKSIAPSVEGDLKGRVDLTAIGSYLPEKGSPVLAGQLDLDINVTGQITDPAGIKPRGQFVITEASYYDSLLPEPIEHFEAHMKLIPDTIEITGLDVRFVSSDVSFSGRLVRPFPYLLPLEKLDRSKLKKPFFTFDLKSHRFDVDKLFPEAVPGSAADPTMKSADSVSMIILPDIDGRGTITIDTLIYSEVKFTEINGKAKIQNRKIDCYDVTGKVYSGSVTGRTSIDLNDFKNPRYEGEFTATQVEANDFATRFSKFGGGHLYGKANITGSYDAYGWDPDAFLNSLSMNGRGEIRDGKVVTSGAVHKLLSSLADYAGESFSEEQPFKGLTTNILVKDGRVKVDKLQTSLGHIGDLNVEGSYGFDGSLDYTGDLELTQVMTDKILSGNKLLAGIASLLTDKQSNRLTLPLAIGGTVENPKAELDFSSLTKGAGPDLQKQAGDFLQGLFKKKK